MASTASERFRETFGRFDFDIGWVASYSARTDDAQKLVDLLPRVMLGETSAHSFRLEPLPMVPIALVSMPDAGNKWGIPLIFCPIDRELLRREGVEHVAGAGLDGIVFDWGALGASFWARLDKNDRHIWILCAVLSYLHSV